MTIDRATADAGKNGSDHPLTRLEDHLQEALDDGGAGKDYYIRAALQDLVVLQEGSRATPAEDDERSGPAGPNRN